MALEDIRGNARNPKDHDIGAIQKSIERFGFVDAVIIDERTGLLVSGHGRLETLTAIHRAGGAAPAGVVQSDGRWLIPVQRGWASNSDEDASAYLIAANKTVELGGWDDHKLSELLSELARSGPGALNGVGFDGDDVDRLANELASLTGSLDDDQAPPAASSSNTVIGDRFKLGEHVVLCGDSTNPAHVSMLMDGESANCVWTDPPYGVEYEGAAGAIANDDKAGLPKLLEGAFAQCFRVLKPGGAIYVAHPSGDNTPTFVTEFLRAGFRWKQHLVWAKDAFVLGHSDYHYQHEMVIYGMRPAGSGRFGRGADGWYGDNAQTSVAHIPKPRRSEEHPTMKPVELVEAHLKNSTAPGHLVFEPFSGSGTTLIACERLGRRCRAMEFDPRFVDVVVARWEGVSGQRAVKIPANGGL